jgi:hypothetical protein
MVAQSELEDLREMKADMERKDAQTSAIIKRQAEQIEQLENLYREEQILRKKYFNKMEDMKGKIRVFCRTRPLSSKVCIYSVTLVTWAKMPINANHVGQNAAVMEYQ